MNRTCRNCKNTFEHKGATRGIFCSVECYQEYRKSPQHEYKKAVYVTLTCAKCGNSFERREKEVIRRRSDRTFCSQSCAGAATYTRGRPSYRTSTMIACKECGKEFKATATMIKDGRKYCGRECSIRARSATITGETNPNYRHGTNQGAAKNVAKRHYPMRCILCGFDIAVEVHHILPKSKGGTNHPDNLAVLCPNHHAMAGLNLVSEEELINASRKSRLPLPLRSPLSKGSNNGLDRLP